MKPTLVDSWSHLRRHTSARIALGRCGGSQPSSAILDFRIAHAAARDAVQAEFKAAELASSIAKLGTTTLTIDTAARTRQEYLLRPDLGRRLSDTSSDFLKAKASDWGPSDLVIIISDGLSALAAHKQSEPLLKHLLPALEARGFSRFPVLFAPFGRVKLQDEVGALLGAKLSLMLLGERPGLGTPDSLGAYFTWNPAPARTDADRNCLSNIRPEGLPPAAAADKLVHLLTEARRLQLSGVRLKDDEARNLVAA